MKKLLALNRGEIAVRILRAANELGMRTVAVFSKEDRLALHRFKADEAYLVGEGKGPVQAYLDVEGIVSLAAEKGVEYIHPGYGFLSENPELPRACARAGITFVGPDARLMELLGDKTAARSLAQAAGLPIIPGTESAITNMGEAEAVGRQIGLPLIVKAAFGGGGRGMRVVLDAKELGQRLREASAEALAAFGNGAVFLERYIRRARHVEVQILADRHGNVVHLFERDCSVQRRHQKVVEVAPAITISRELRARICDAAVQLARHAGYVNAGTVEFLVDADTNEFFFIEVNPRIQVEHTVTEMVTGIDIVRSQILVAQGQRLDSEAIRIPSQEDVTLRGVSIQCRITTEDPANQFLPDYGKLNTYRSPAGFGIRLDGGTAYSGAVITPFYDSLLVKTTAWGRDFTQARERMDRALREFRIRGVKTNIPFLENVINHPVFAAGDATTGFIEAHPELFKFSPRRDRATKLLTYLGEVTVNGNPQVAGRPVPGAFAKAPIPEHAGSAAPAGTRQLLLQLGAEGFAAWVRKQKRLLLTDTTFRDAHQSLLATRMRTHDMLAIANHVAHRTPELFSVEMWGGATFDVCLRFLHEDPWLRLVRLREAIPNICFQMLLRASNAVGYTAYPDNVVREFVKESAAQGIDIFRIFDSLNWLPNMKVAMEAARKTSSICEAAICYTGDILDPQRDKYPLQYYVRLAKELEKMGAHILGIKDMAGLCKPYAAKKLIKALRDEVGLPIHFHTHDTSGASAASVLMAADDGVDIADAAISSMSGTTSQPNLNSIVAALRHTRRDTGLDPDALQLSADYFEAVREWYAPFDTGLKTGTAEVYLHEMPGGQFTNLKEQAKSMGLGEKWPLIARTYADVNMLLGDIVKVTPSSKVVGDLALFLVSHDMTVNEFARLDENHALTLPNSVIDMLMGSLGEPEGGWPTKVRKTILKGAKPLRGRPGASLPAANFAETRAIIEKKTGHQATQADTLSYLLYPEVYLAYDKARQRYSNLDVLPTPQFFYGMKPGEEVAVELEEGKSLVVKLLTVSNPHPEGHRTIFFELNGQPREVDVRDLSLEVKQEQRPKADQNLPGHVGAPIPGMVSSISVELHQQVEKGDKLLVMEAMKMQTTVYAPIAGKVLERHVAVGAQVEAKDLMLVIG